MKRPNILYLHSHDTGRYVQPMGHAVATPNLQKLAEQGVLFRQAFCAAPTCSPSRAALVTGQCPHASGMLGLAHRGFSLTDYSRHIVHTLRAAGYASALAGVQHVAADLPTGQAGPERIGYDAVLPTTGGIEGITRAAAQFLEQPPAQPFFVSVGYGPTHRPFPEPSPADPPQYCLPPAPMPDAPETRRDMAGFKVLARKLDQQYGAVLGVLDAAGLAENTIVICTTDHGIAFPQMKCNLTDHGVGVFLIIRGPGPGARAGGFVGGKVCDAMVSQIDLFPTLCDLLQIDRPTWLEGASMMPLVRGEAEEIHDEIFAEVTYHAAYEPQRAVRTKRWKYIRRFDDRERAVLPNTDNGHAKTMLAEQGWADRPVPPEQLYDLLYDPNEACNLAPDASCGTALDEMRKRLDNWMRRTADPLLNGPVPPPSGAKVTDSDSYSPRDNVRTIP